MSSSLSPLYIGELVCATFNSELNMAPDAPIKNTHTHTHAMHVRSHVYITHLTIVN